MTEEKLLLAGGKRHAKSAPVRNTILLSLPEAEFRCVSDSLEHVQLSRHHSLHEPTEVLDHVYFPNGGLISLVVATEDGKTVEAGVVGKEGMVGTPLVVGLRHSPLREIVQIPSDGFRIKAAALQAALPGAPAFQITLSRYAVIQGMQTAQTAACNRLHDVAQRLARWLLTAVDRVDSDSLPITHDYLATMLGTDRPSVSVAAGILQKENSIKYTRGSVKVLDRVALEESACECYRVIHQLNDDMD
ncbi:MAG: Crp/Fnr family transcriptional regulator [Candidatus Acidiferrales bacterium]